MSKVGTIEIDVYSVYKREQLQAFAKKANITLQQAESLAKERLYRMEYNKRRSLLPEVKAKRKEYNQKRHAMHKALAAIK